MRINSVWTCVLWVRGGVRAEFNRREATCVSKSNVFGGFSKHMWLFEEEFMEEAPGFL